MKINNSTYFTFFPLILVTLFLQNEPNLTRHPSNLSAVLIETYNERSLPGHDQNEPNRTQYEPNTNPISKRPKINPNFCCSRELQRKTNFAPKNNEPNRTQSQPKTKPKRIQFREVFQIFCFPFQKSRPNNV